MKLNLQRKLSELNQYGLDNIERLKELAKEVEAIGFADTELIETGQGDYVLTFEHEGEKYQIRRDYHRHIQISEYPYIRFENVSSYKRTEVYNKHKEQNMKVMTRKKVLARVEALKAIKAELQEAEDTSFNKVADFIASLEALKANGVPYTISEDSKRGYIERGGLEFSFEISQDGYISKRIKVMHSVETTLENFMKLSDNTY